MMSWWLFAFCNTRCYGCFRFAPALNWQNKQKRNLTASDFQAWFLVYSASTRSDSFRDSSTRGSRSELVREPRKNATFFLFSHGHFLAFLKHRRYYNNNTNNIINQQRHNNNNEKLSHMCEIFLPQHKTLIQLKVVEMRQVFEITAGSAISHNTKGILRVSRNSCFFCKHLLFVSLFGPVGFQR
jgi:thioredoxin-related protein